MTARYFEISVRYDRIQENGTARKVTEKYLADALTCTESEARTIEELAPLLGGEYQVKVIKDTKIEEIFFNKNGDRYWLVNVASVAPNEKSGREKETVSQILVQANDFDDAVAAFKEGMKGSMADWRIKSVSETPYMDVFPAKI